MMAITEVMVMIKVNIITKLMMMVMIKVLMILLTSLQCLGSAFLPNTGVEARTEQRRLSWSCRQPDGQPDKS